jgi:hypothetical protein
MILSLQILKLIESSPIPVRTGDLVAITVTGKSHPRSRVHAELRKLAAAGLVRRMGLVKVRGERGGWYEQSWARP